MLMIVYVFIKVGGEANIYNQQEKLLLLSFEKGITHDEEDDNDEDRMMGESYLSFF